MKQVFNYVLVAMLGLLLAACGSELAPTHVAPQAALPEGAEVCFYEHNDFLGASLCHDVNDGDVAKLAEFNNLITSVQVAPGYEVVLYPKFDFKGRSLTLGKNDTNLTGESFNDRASSFKVRKTDGGADEDDDDTDNGGDAALDQKCTPEIEIETEDQAAAQPLLDIYPDTRLKMIAAKVCNVLYDTAEEARAPEKVILRIINEPDGVPAFAIPGLPVAEYAINMNHLKNYQGDAFVEEFEGITAHELTHVYQNFGSGASTGLTEGIADYVRFSVGYTPPGAQPDKNGNWDDGYRTTAFFLIWVEEQNPGFLRKLNLAIEDGFDVDATFESLTGKTPDALWTNYQNDDSEPPTDPTPDPDPEDPTPDPDPEDPTPDPDPDSDLDAKCTPEITLNLEDKNTSRTDLFLDVAGNDPDEFLQDIGRKVCRILYKEVSEVRDANKLELILRYDTETIAYKSGNIGDITIMVSTHWLNNVDQDGGDVAEAVTGVLVHEMTHMYQQDDQDGGGVDLGLIEGIADFVRFESGYTPADAQPNKDGNWNDGYRTTAYFLVWLNENYADFVYELNKSMNNTDGKTWTPAAFEDITGKSVDALWQAYVNDDS